MLSVVYDLDQESNDVVGELAKPQSRAKGDIEAEIPKGAKVPEANAIRDPRTVMIHFQNALVADRTMVSPWWLPVLAFFAVIHWENKLVRVSVGRWLVLRDDAGVNEARGQITPDNHHEKEENESLDHH